MSNNDFCNDPTCDLIKEGIRHEKHDLSVHLEKRSKSFADLLKNGFKISGSAIGAGLGFVFGGPPGVVIGAGIGSTIEIIGQEIGNRYLSIREKQRLGYTVILAADKIKKNVEKGMQYRTDGFFEDKQGERSAAKEIVEGILIASQREHQEKKLHFYANLLANLAFHPEIDRAHANLLLRLAERLSYRQLCIISLFKEKIKYNLRQTAYSGPGTVSGLDLIVALQEIFELYSIGLLNASQDALLTIPDITPSKMNVQGTGDVLYQLMELGEIKEEDRSELSTILT